MIRRWAIEHILEHIGLRVVQKGAEFALGTSENEPDVTGFGRIDWVLEFEVGGCGIILGCRMAEYSQELFGGRGPFDSEVVYTLAQASSIGHKQASFGKGLGSGCGQSRRCAESVALP